MRPEGRAGHARRILIVDDHPVVRNGLRALLSHEPGIEISGEAASAREAMKLLEGLPVDLMIVDISLQDGNGIDLIKRARARFPSVLALVSSMHDETLYASRALQAGAMGYVSKQEPVEKLLEAIRLVLGGGVYLSPDMTARMVERKRTGEPRELDSPFAALSDRELEVFEAIGRGRSTREIAETLDLSVKTIETHRENIKRKLALGSNTELIQRSFLWVLGKQ